MEKQIRKYLEKNGDRLYDSLSKTKLPANKAKVKFSEMAAGFVPNFKNTTSVFRGIGGRRLMEEYQERNLTPTAEQIQESIFKKKWMDSPGGSQLANLRAQGGTTIKEKRNAAFGDEFSLENLAVYLKRHQSGGSGSGLLSASFSKDIGLNFTNPDIDGPAEEENLGELQMPTSRIMNTAKLKKMTERFGANKVSQVLRNSSSEANAAKGRKNKFVGFDVNDITKGYYKKRPKASPHSLFSLPNAATDYSGEKEVALMSGGFVPNFKKTSAFTSVFRGVGGSRAGKRQAELAVQGKELTAEERKDLIFTKKQNPDGSTWMRNTHAKRKDAAFGAGLSPKDLALYFSFPKFKFLPFYFDL
jgi:hypothetical protein